jgi:hypothetical protein
MFLQQNLREGRPDVSLDTPPSQLAFFARLYCIHFSVSPLSISDRLMLNRRPPEELSSELRTCSRPQARVARTLPDLEKTT